MPTLPVYITNPVVVKHEQETYTTGCVPISGITKLCFPNNMFGSTGMGVNNMRTFKQLKHTDIYCTIVTELQGGNYSPLNPTKLNGDKWQEASKQDASNRKLCINGAVLTELFGKEALWELQHR